MNRKNLLKPMMFCAAIIMACAMLIISGCAYMAPSTQPWSETTTKYFNITGPSDVVTRLIQHTDVDQINRDVSKLLGVNPRKARVIILPWDYFSFICSENSLACIHFTEDRHIFLYEGYVHNMTSETFAHESAHLNGCLNEFKAEYIAKLVMQLL